MQFSSSFKVNRFYYISTLPPGQKYIVEDTQKALKEYLVDIGIPFQEFEVENKQQLIDLLIQIKISAEQYGTCPILHLIGHGGQNSGLEISEANEMLYWDELGEYFQSINLACHNNLVVVASSCFGFEVVENVKLIQPVPFYAFIAPEGKLFFNYFNSGTISFYKAIFSGMDLFEAHKAFTAEQTTLFHCEKMFATVLGRYVLRECRGNGRLLRLDRLAEQALEGNRFSSSPDMVHKLRELADSHIEPTQELLDKYASIFLAGRNAGFTMEDVLSIVDGPESSPSEG